MERRTALKLMGASLGLSLFGFPGCGPLDEEWEPDPWDWEIAVRDPNIPPECFTTDNPVSILLGRINLVVPGAYLNAVGKQVLFMQNKLSQFHPNARNLTDIIFYDTQPPACYEKNDVQFLETNGGISNGINYILINDWIFSSLILGQQYQRVDYFGHILSGPKHILSHEFGHILFGGRPTPSGWEPAFSSWSDEELHELAPENNGFGDDARHYLIDQFGYLVEMSYTLENSDTLENNPIFENNYLPILREHPELIPEAREKVDEWNINPLINTGEEYHNRQLAFLVSEGAISPVYSGVLRFEEIRVRLTDLLELQKANAIAKLDQI